MSTSPPVEPPPGWKLARVTPPVPREPAARAAARWSQPRRRGTGGWTWRQPRAWLICYLVAVTLVALWPAPVDSGAGRLLRAITRVFPFLTYMRIEFGSNVLLFVPLGVLLALLVKTRRYLVVPMAMVSSAAIEVTQAVFLSARTASPLDVLANTLGACVGLLLVEGIEGWRTRHRPK